MRVAHSIFDVVMMVCAGVALLIDRWDVATCFVSLAVYGQIVTADQ